MPSGTDNNGCKDTPAEAISALFQSPPAAYTARPTNVLAAGV